MSASNLPAPDDVVGGQPSGFSVDNNGSSWLQVFLIKEESHTQLLLNIFIKTL